MTSDLLPTLLFAALAGVLVVLLGLQYRARRLQQSRVHLLAAALSTISGICYLAGRLGQEKEDGGQRVDGRRDHADWPFLLDDLLAALGAEAAHVVRAARQDLATTGQGFFLTLVDQAQRTLQLTGHRLTAPGLAPFDLIWVTDVSQRAAAETEGLQARRDRDRLHGLIDTLPVPIWQRGPDLGIVFGSQRFQDIPALSFASSAAAAAALDTGIEQSIQHTANVDGERRWFELIEAPDGTGGTVGLAFDQTQLHRLRIELRRVGMAHREVLEHLAIAIAIYGPDGRLLFHNTAFERFWQLDSAFLESEPNLAEVLDALRARRILPEYADYRKFKAAQSELLTTLKETTSELMHLPDERTLRLVVSRHPFGGLTFTYEDVTASLALERSFNTLSQVQKETLDHLFEAIAVFGSDGRLTLSNPAFATLWNLDPAELEKRPHITALVEWLRPHYSDETWPAARAELIDCIIGYAARTERLERIDGRVLDVSSIPLPDGNILLGYLDVTDSVQVQRALGEKNDALEAAAMLKTEFIANISYELRTPLNAIIGFADILTNQYFGTLNERQIDYSRGILESSHRLLALINDILDIATIEAGQLQLAPAPVDIHTLVANILATSRERARRLDLTLGIDCPTDIGEMTVDEARLRQALFNLVSNAMKFTPSGGSITLSARRRDNEIGLSVSDTGIGIAQNLQQRVFETFDRGDRRGQQVGAGLGLSLVKKIVELHGGRVELASANGKGTTVTCWLPADRQGAGRAGPGRLESDWLTRRSAVPSTSNIRSEALRQDERAGE